MSLNVKSINKFTQQKIWISQRDVQMCTDTPKNYAQSGRSALDIFNTLRVFTPKPIRGQKIKQECVNT